MEENERETERDSEREKERKNSRKREGWMSNDARSAHQKGHTVKSP